MFRLLLSRPGVFCIAVSVLASLVAISQVEAEPAVAAPSGVALAGVHFYNSNPELTGLPGLLDNAVPLGQRGWNVEYIPNVAGCDLRMRDFAQQAKNAGLVNIIRIDYGNGWAVPVNPLEYETWKNAFKNCIANFGDVASLYIVGNEPNLDCGPKDPAGRCLAPPITATQYANAFNYLFDRKVELLAGTELLAVANSPFTPPIWMYSMTSRLHGADGFAFHTGGSGTSGSRPGCVDPRQPCTAFNNRWDGTFRYYRDVISQLDQRWWSKPVYLTEFNTFTGGPGTEPINNYPPGWITKAFQEIRHYNANRNGRPEIKALIWFIDVDQLRSRASAPNNWWDWALSNPDPQTQQARADLAKEFSNPLNRAPSTGVNPHFDAFVKNDQNQISHYWRSGSSSAWENLSVWSGGIVSDPAAVAWGSPLANGGSGRVDVFALCNWWFEVHLCHSWFDGQWHAWEDWGRPPGVSLIYAPDVASWSWGDLKVFVVGSNRQIWQINYTIEGGRSVWHQPFADGAAYSGVSVLSWGSGRTDLFVRGAENQLWHRTMTQQDDGSSEGWGGWKIGTGVLTTGPDAASWGAGHIDVFVAGVNSVPYRLNWNGDQSLTWEQVPDGSFAFDPGAAALARNQVSLFARGIGNDGLWRKPWVSGWGAWEPFYGVLTSGPDAASWSLR